MLNKELLCGCASPKLGIGELEVSYISDSAGDNILIEATFQDGTQKTITLLTWKDTSIPKISDFRAVDRSRELLKSLRH